MIKIIFLLLILLEFFYAEEIKFTQSKYINALDMSIKKIGILNFREDNLILQYSGENKIINFTKNNIIILNKNQKETLTYEKNIKLFLFYNLLKSIFTNNNSSLEDNFNIVKKEDETTLVPKDYISNIIKKIVFKKVKNKLEYLNIYFINKDRITIVENK